ncbi:bifunctional UDP-N-acetylmuramoyl-tripeptide:D-alanyl-D-alanine ligase/alanine racemase [bacterium]|nr:bifunctional UDP-N-acetylmuramoyl-tripeptide:D-alanyl-D-alanine ligase/alanine racemase [bacterium]
MYTAGDIAKIVNGTLVGDAGIHIKSLAFDSRKIGRPAETLFFAIRSQHADGHKYLNEVKAAGIAAVVVDHDPEIDGLNYIRVQDTLAALQTLAKDHRNRFDLKVVGITGSNGKTIVKEWIYHLAASTFNTVKNPKSYNSQIGVPFSIWNIKKEHKLGIFEAGISQPGEMSRLEQIIQPHIGIFTYLGDAHNANFKSDEEKLEEKLQLFDHCETVICPANQTLALQKLREKGLNVLTWSDKETAQLQVLNVQKEKSETRVQLLYRGSGITFDLDLPFSDDSSIHNALSASLCALHLGVSVEELRSKAKSLQAIDMRLQQVPGINQNHLVLDFYNSDMESLKIALDFLKQQQGDKKAVIILSDILQSGLDETSIVKDIQKLLKEYSVKKLIAIGNQFKQLQADHYEIEVFEDTDDFLNRFPLYTLHDDFILLKGARPFKFEKIADRLSAKVHQTVLEVNMTQLQLNLKLHQAQSGPNTKTMAMVKAFAYGVGGYEVAKLMEYNKVDYLGVAYLDEAISLRESGIHAPIMILNADFSKASTISEYQVEPTVYSLESLSDLIRYGDGLPITIHLEFDTGMHRLGFTDEDLEALIKILHQHENLKPASVYSHLAVADDSSQDEFTLSQYKRFSLIAKRIKQEFGEEVLSHISNSSGIQRFPEFDLDMVRLGIGLYGISSDPEIGEKLDNVVTFKSYIAQIRIVKAGEGIGYGLHSKSDRDRKIAVVAVGYADGYSRDYSQGKGYFLINNKKAEVTGNVCMDMTMCDVTDIDCKAGDEVIIFGEHPSIEELAKIQNTIPYEVLSAVSQRVNRVFYQE